MVLRIVVPIVSDNESIALQFDLEKDRKIRSQIKGQLEKKSFRKTLEIFFQSLALGP